MTTNWSAERHDCLTQLECEAERRPSLGRFAARGLPVEARHCKTEVFIVGSTPMNTEVFSFVHLILEAGKKITNWMCDNCGLVQRFGAPLRRRRRLVKGKGCDEEGIFERTVFNGKPKSAQT